MIFWGRLVFSRENRRPKRAKTKIYFTFVGCRAYVVALHLGRWWCPLIQRWAGLRGFRTCHRSALVLWWLAPCLLSALPLCLWWIACKCGFISQFKAVFRGFYMFGVGLYCLGALRGLWGFCVREWLGGLEACGVFASILSSRLPFVFFSCPLVLLSCFRLLSCLASCLACFPALCLAFLALWHGFWRWLGCCFFFPYGLYAKERALRVGASSLVLLWVCL